MIEKIVELLAPHVVKLFIAGVLIGALIAHKQKLAGLL